MCRRTRAPSAVFKSKLTPAYDKAFQGTYPAGSTFKPITARPPTSRASWHRARSWTARARTSPSTTSPRRRPMFHDWTPLSMGPMGLAKALEVSCDTFFYQLGDRFWGMQGDGQAFQGWLRKLGYGAAPPLDAGGAQAGVVPDASGRPPQTWPGTPDQQAIEQSWLPGRRHQHVDRPGQPARLAAAAGGRLQRARERRQGGNAARRRRRSSSPAATTQTIPGGRIDPRPVRRPAPALRRS